MKKTRYRIEGGFRGEKGWYATSQPPREMGSEEAALGWLNRRKEVDPGPRTKYRMVIETVETLTIAETEKRREGIS